MANPNSPWVRGINTIALSVAVSADPAGDIRSVSFGLGGSWTVAAVANAFGFAFDVPESAVRLTEYTFLYNKLPWKLGFAVKANIPGGCCCGFSRPC
jgi:hypothetical protein